MLITLRQLRQIIAEEISIPSRGSERQRASTIVYFYPGLYPNSDKHSVQKYLHSKIGSQSTTEYVDGNMFIRTNRALFVVPKDHKVSFDEIESITKDMVEGYDNTRKLIGGYSAGSKGVASAQGSGSSFDYVILADPTPHSGITWDLLTYTPENWGNGAEPGGWYNRRLRVMLGVSKIPSAEDNTQSTTRLPKIDHHVHMNSAVDRLINMAS